MRRTFFFRWPFIFALGAKAAAQTCVGMPSFSSGHMQVAGGGPFADGSSSFGGTFGYGTPKSLYGKAGIGTTSYDGFDGSSFDFDVSGGYQVPLHAKQTAEALSHCQPEPGLRPERRSAAAWICRAARSRSAPRSARWWANPQLQIVPNASFQFANTRNTVDDGTTSASGSESYGLLTVGTGFVFNSRFSLNPSISFPIGLDGGEHVLRSQRGDELRSLRTKKRRGGARRCCARSAPSHFLPWAFSCPLLRCAAF